MPEPSPTEPSPTETSPTEPGSPAPSTVVSESPRRVDGSYGLRVGVLVVVVLVRLAMDEPVDTGTGIALGFLGAVAVASAAWWVRVRRHPMSIVVTDDEIHSDPPGPDPDRRRLDRSVGALRLRRVGRRLGPDAMLTGTVGNAQVPVRFIETAELLDACERHGWPLAEE